MPDKTLDRIYFRKLCNYPLASQEVRAETEEWADVVLDAAISFPHRSLQNGTVLGKNAGYDLGAADRDMWIVLGVITPTARTHR